MVSPSGVDERCERQTSSLSGVQIRQGPEETAAGCMEEIIGTVLVKSETAIQKQPYDKLEYEN